MAPAAAPAAAPTATDVGSTLAQAPVTPAGITLTIPLLTVAVITSLFGLGLAGRYWLASQVNSAQEVLRVAGQQMARGNPMLAGELARGVSFDEDVAPSLVTMQQFLIGAGAAHEGFGKSSTQAGRAAYHRALKHLRQASTAWPSGYEDEGERLLGEVLARLGHFSEAIPHIKRVLDRNPNYEPVLKPTLLDCLLHGNPSQLAAGLQLVDETLDGPLASAIGPARLQRLRAEFLIRQGNYSKAQQQLTQMLDNHRPRRGETTSLDGSERDELRLLSAVAGISEGIDRFGPGSITAPQQRPEVERFLAPYVESLRRIQRDAEPGVALRAGRWLARAHLCQGNPKDALSQWVAVRLHNPLGGEGIAAGLSEMEHLVAVGQVDEAVQTARYIVREVGSESNYDASVVDLVQFRRRVKTVLADLREMGAVEAGVSLARSLPPLLSVDVALFEEALAFRQAGDQLSSRLAEDKRQPNAPDLVQARAYYGQAGDAFEAAARLRFTSDQYTETLWQAISALQQAGQFSRTIEPLEEYLRYERRIRQPRALVALGRARLADGDPEAAVLPLTRCIDEFSRDPLAYDARLIAAKAYAEMDQLDAAAALLDVNLTDGALTPSSTVWRDSLLTHAELLWRRARDTHAQAELQVRLRRKPHSLETLRANQPHIEQAIMRLDEAVQRFWPSPRTLNAAVLLSKAYRLAAELPAAEAGAPDVLEATRRLLLKRREDMLREALQPLQMVRRKLLEIEDERPLTGAEQTTYLSVLLGEADVLYDLGRYEQAADIYRTLSLKYLNEPPSLEALLGQARCLRAQNREDEARMAIRQAVIVLERIPDDMDERFLQSTRYDRKGWRELLTWLDRSPLPEIPGAS